MRFDGKWLGQIAISEDLQTVLDSPNQPSIEKRFNIDAASSLKNFQLTDIDESVFLAGQRSKTTLGQTTLHGHLTAFKTGLDAAATTGLLTLMSLGCSLTVT